MKSNKVEKKPSPSGQVGDCWDVEIGTSGRMRIGYRIMDIVIAKNFEIFKIEVKDCTFLPKNDCNMNKLNTL